jgi:hypothetical protein
MADRSCNTRWNRQPSTQAIVHGQRSLTHLVGKRDGDEAAEEGEVAPGLNTEEAQERMEVFQPVLDRRASQAPPPAGLDGVRSLGGLGVARLDVVRLVEDNAEPLICSRSKGVRSARIPPAQSESRREEC